ncbi:hypothetical protein FACS189464_2030 [Bacteroidia bacterium]|nr:hypothetical protein FACS189430_12250 [Bacteroidia bacterium]GHT78497.1 hypothetical protein FACS189464_2030 [Bacteroidia bacterium]
MQKIKLQTKMSNKLKNAEMSNQELILKNEFVSDIRNIIKTSKIHAVRSVDYHRVIMYWKLGERIFVEEQDGKKRAEYGSYMLRNLAEQIEPEFGSGFSVRQLERARQFYRAYPIASAVRTQFQWSQYKLLISIDDNDKREYYEYETLHNCWTGRELERQINSGLYERLLMSNDKKSVLEVARRERIPENPMEIIKDPMVLEILNLKRESAYYEKDLENLLITNLQGAFQIVVFIYPVRDFSSVENRCILQSQHPVGMQQCPREQWLHPVRVGCQKSTHFPKNIRSRNCPLGHPYQ